jgi:GT2 family glycosyltransferase
MTKLQNRVNSSSYSVVIATCDREEMLARVLEDWAAQTVRPEKVVVVRAGGGRRQDSGDRSQEPEAGRTEPEIAPRQMGRRGDQTGDRSQEAADLSLVQLTANERSAAKQRNMGATEVESEWIVFSDDDVRFGPDLAERTLGFLQEHKQAVAVFPRMKNAGHPAPSRLLRKYYRLQAGFDDETYGGRLFGAGISCYPCWEKQPAPVETNWLPSTMLWMRTDLFRRHKFPDFEGYSFGEDAHLTHRVWIEAALGGGKMYFLGEPEFEHHSIHSGVKAARFHLGRMAVRNQKRIAREAMGKTGGEVFWKSILHRVFMTVALAKGRRRGWMGEMAGIWSG